MIESSRIGGRCVSRAMSLAVLKICPCSKRLQSGEDQVFGREAQSHRRLQYEFATQYLIERSRSSIPLKCCAPPYSTPTCCGEAECIKDRSESVFGGDLRAIGRNTLCQQQIRGKQKQAKGNGEVAARLLKDIKSFGKAGSIVPVAAGRMRNSFFPLSMAVYVTPAQLKALNIPRSEIVRDFTFGTRQATDPTTVDNLPVEGTEELIDASMFRKKAPDVTRISPERSMELLEIFVPGKLDFYRQPIIEDLKETEQTLSAREEPAKPTRKPRALYGAGADLMAAREKGPEAPKIATAQAIYGSVSTQDVLVAMRAAMANNDESARVVLLEEDLSFVDLPDIEGAEAGRVKHVGEFTVEVKIKGAEDKASRRVVRVHAQEL
nr:hypothetical protein CFP56_21758 [Quercus suber]